MSGTKPLIADPSPPQSLLLTSSVDRIHTAQDRRQQQQQRRRQLLEQQQLSSESARIAPDPTPPTAASDGFPSALGVQAMTMQVPQLQRGSYLQSAPGAYSLIPGFTVMVPRAPSYVLERDQAAARNPSDNLVAVPGTDPAVNNSSNTPSSHLDAFVDEHHDQQHGDETARTQDDFLAQAILVEEDSDDNNELTAEDREFLEEEAREHVLQEMMVDAQDAVAVEDSEERKQRYRRRRQFWCFLILLLIVLVGGATIAGSMIGAGNSRNSNTAIIITPTPTVSSAPSDGPTLRPTSSSFPSTIPSTSPSTAPSETPTLSPRPSQMPSTSPSDLPSSVPTETPDNNYCEDAKQIFVGDTIFIEELYSSAVSIPMKAADTVSPVSSTPSSSPGTDIPSIASSSAEMPQTSNIFARNSSSNLSLASRQFEQDGVLYQNIIDCQSGMFYNAPGRWFRLKRIGPVTVTTCSDRTSAKTAIQIYSDVENCLPSNPFDSPFDCPLGLKQISSSIGSCSTISWNSLLDADYLVLATESVDLSGAGGSIEMSIFNNNECTTAFGPVSPNGASLFGSLSGEVASVDESIPSCGEASEPTQPGVWFQIKGTGGLLKVDACSGSSISTQISVFQGQCGSLECVDGDNNACGSQSLVSWISESEVLYYVLVHGGGGILGDFFLNFEGETSALAANDICENAKPLEVEIGKEASEIVPMGQANIDRNTQSCLGVFMDMSLRGLWYTLVGAEGKFYNISLSSDIGEDAMVTAFFGDCDDLGCLRYGGAGELPMFDGAALSWESVPGETYYIYVYYVREDVTESDSLLAVSATNTAV